MQVNRFRDELERHGISRRDFLAFCASMASILGLPEPAIAAAVQAPKKPILIWLEFQDCAGDSESLLRAAHPTIADLLLDSISLNYHETLMAAAGSQAEQALASTLRDYAGQYIALVEGSIPAGADGAYCMIGGKSALQMAREVCGQAAAVVAVGSCAAFGGLPAAKPNPTGAMSVADAVPGIPNLINLSACPANAENIAALVVYFMTLKRWPPTDRYHRPLFAYGKTIHDNCERRAHFDAGQYAEAWGDEAHRQGACLYKLGCKGPATSHNCPVVRWNEGSNWPVGCGHPCIGCAEPDFWDTMTPLYGRLPDVAGYDVGRWIDPAGLALTGVTAAGVAMHGIGEAVLHRFRKRKPEQPQEAPEAEE